MKYVLQYADGAYESNFGSGFPCALIEEAAKFDSLADAVDHAEKLEETIIIEVAE